MTFNLAYKIQHLPVCRQRVGGFHSRAGLTILEVSIALTVFLVATLGFSLTQIAMNKKAIQMRCEAIASAILRARVAKVLTDTWIPQTIPSDCVVSTGEVDVVKDPSDPYDVGSSVTLLSNSAVIGGIAPGTDLVSGTLRRTTTQFEANAKTVLINYRLFYTYRGTVYQNFASTIRASDK